METPQTKRKLRTSDFGTLWVVDASPLAALDKLAVQLTAISESERQQVQNVSVIVSRVAMEHNVTGYALYCLYSLSRA